MTEALLIALLIVGIANIALTILLISSRRTPRGDRPPEAGHAG